MTRPIILAAALLFPPLALTGCVAAIGWLLLRITINAMR